MLPECVCVCEWKIRIYTKCMRLNFTFSFDRLDEMCSVLFFSFHSSLFIPFQSYFCAFFSYENKKTENERKLQCATLLQHFGHDGIAMSSNKMKMKMERGKIGGEKKDERTTMTKNILVIVVFCHRHSSLSVLSL